VTKCDKGGMGYIFAQNSVTSFMDGPKTAADLIVFSTFFFSIVEKLDLVST